MEEWREVQDYPGYSVSNLGRVKSLKRGGQRILRPNYRKEYLVVGLYKNNIKHNVAIHRLIAMTFIPNHDNKPDVDHINRSKTDNRVVNLRWATESENAFNIRCWATNTSGFRGVYLMNGKYTSKMTVNGNNIHLGHFDTPEEAHAVYEAKARELHGVFFQF